MAEVKIFKVFLKSNFVNNAKSRKWFLSYHIKRVKDIYLNAHSKT